jgi:molybdopterin/thiamine biosynthesis adenylyltransferase
MSTPEHFQRIDGRVHVQRLAACRVALIGVGAVGSRIADELARSGVGSLLLVDGDTLEAANLARHVLGADSVGDNKAHGLAERLAATIPSLQVAYLARHVTDRVPDAAIRGLLATADAVVVATDDRRVQRRIGRIALGADLPAVFPGVDVTAGRGEVFVALGAHTPCFSCFDEFRAPEAPLRAPIALNIDIYATVDIAVRVVLGVLDPLSQFADLMRGTAEDPRPRTIFLVSGPGRGTGLFSEGRSIRRGIPDFRPGCPACAPVRPATPRPSAVRPAPPPDLWTSATSTRWLLAVPMALFTLGLLVPSGVVWALAALSGIGAVVIFGRDSTEP